jgi:GntR family transcriptional regulator
MNINPARGQFRQVADLIRAAIGDGTYPRGSVLPTEDQLADRLGVTRPVVNRALRVLTAEGLVRPVKGKGTYVTKIPPIARNAVARYSREMRESADGRGAFDTEIRRLGMTPKSEMTVSRVEPPEVAREILGTEAGGQVVVRARRMYADDTPVQLADSYIPLDIAGGTVLEETDSGPGGMLSRLAELGHAQVRITERIRVRPPTPAEASFLGLSEDQRVYEVAHTGWTAEGRPVEVCIHTMPTHLWLLDFEWPADPPG